MKKTFLNLFISLSIPILVYLVFLVTNFSRIGNINSIYTIFLQSIIPTIMGYGVAFGFISGIFDFTIGSRLIIAAIVGGILVNYIGYWGLVLGCLLASVFIGIFTGIINWLTKIPSLVVTLGLTLVYEIVGYNLSIITLIRLNSTNDELGEPIPNIAIMIAAALVFYILFYHSKFSSHVRAMGSNVILAKTMGIDIDRTKILTFIVGGLFLGIAGLLQISVSGTISMPINLGSASMLFKPLMGVLVALVLQPICNLAIGIFIGSFTVNTIFVGMIASGLPDTYQNVVLGFFILIVMVISQNKDAIRRFMKKILKKRQMKFGDI